MKSNLAIFRDVSRQDSGLAHCDEELNYVSQCVEEIDIHHHVDENFESEKKSDENFYFDYIFCWLPCG